MSSFEAWLERHPFSWHPGRDHTQEQHINWVQMMILSVQGLLSTGLRESVPEWLEALECELPPGFMSPYDASVYESIKRTRSDAEKKCLLENFERCVDELAAFDRNWTISMLHQTAKSLKRPSPSTSSLTLESQQ